MKKRTALPNYYRPPSFQQQRRNSRKRMARRNLKYAIRPQNWVEIIERALARRLKPKTAHALPVHLRPHVPHVRQTLERGGPEADKLKQAIRKACTASQWKHLQAVHSFLA